MDLQNELLELSNKVEQECNKINIIGNIKTTIELNSDELTLPYVFECEALHPGVYKGFTIEEQDIIAAQNTIFNNIGNFANNEINKDHKNNRKDESSVDDLIGRVIDSKYDYSKQAYILKGEIYNKELALKIHNKLVKYVSLRINPGYVDFIGDKKFARNLSFEELSFVRAPGDPNVKIL